MIIVYDSRFGLGETFAKGLGYETQDITKSLNDKCILVTRNDGFGEIPASTKEFIDVNQDKILGVVVNGNKENHADSYNFAADKIKDIYGLTIIVRIDGSGTLEDREVVKNFIENI